MNLAVRTTPEAEDQVRAIDDWWRQHRLAAPDLFLDGLEAAFALIGLAPNVGHPYRRSPVFGTRRILLARTRYHVYYVPSDSDIPRARGLARQARERPPVAPRVASRR